MYLNLAVVIAYGLLTVLVSWPILPNFDKQVVAPGDPFFISWVLGSETWTLRTGDFANFWNQNIFYPYNNTLAFSDHSVTLMLQSLPTYLISSDPIVIINSLNLESLFLSALFAYFLILYYTGSRKAAFTGGIVYGFSSYHVTQLIHIQVSNYQYIPLALLFFEKLLKTPNWKNALFFSLTFTLNALVSIYLLGFVLIPLGIILVLRFLSREIVINNRLLLRFLLAAVLTGALVVPWLLPYLGVAQDFNSVHGAEEYYSYSAHWGDFLIANDSSWLLGGYSSQVKLEEPFGAWAERTLYIGFFTIGLALLGVVTRDSLKKRFVITSSSISWFVILLVCLVLSFGPVLSMLDVTHPALFGPYILLFKLIPLYQGIRVPSRSMVIVVLALAVLIGFTTKKVELLGPRKRQLAYTAIGLILVFEQGSFPLNLVTPPPNNTTLYVWTAANLPKDAALVHYPFDKFEADLSYLWGSLVDHKRILNGYSSFIPESIKRLQNLSQTDPASFLKICATLGINYLVIHGNYVSPTDSLAQYLKEKSLVQLATIGTDSVYDISSGKDINFHTVPTTYSSQIKNGRLTIEQKNNTSSIWVSSQVERFDIQLNFIKEGNKVGQNKFSTYKPLFLMPGESFVTSLEVSPPLFTGYDDVGIDIK